MVTLHVKMDDYYTLKCIMVEILSAMILLGNYSYY